ncbi:hypothetical protein SUGI_0335130 [Cryptomeria japonica]|uniref:probable carboxylesterase 17 n=1 Tax=Cryptomeria japonica TaxID=3369 RepID=UPI002408D14A|nr:probable carboxylesterase 17 [Cryptomeria japonica]GLJ18769.1 hypothetical protein SUGI_0335130 [Cryptomeria japonica]
MNMDTISVDGVIRSDHGHDPARSRGRSVEEELEGFLRVYKDGAVERFSYVVSDVPATEAPQEPVASKDVVMDSRTGVWARFYLPRKALSRETKLPLLIYFHGGGFVLGSPAWSIYHVFMSRMASHTNSMIMSVAYRLAPEHRLPAAYDDCFGAVKWVRRQATHERSHASWLSSSADFSQCFLAGDSAGGNIVHNVALQCARVDVKPLQMRGLILLQPFFGGENPCKREVEMSETDTNLTQRWVDVFWKLSLPVGAKRDHPACNPLAMSLRDLSLPPVIVIISEKDLLKQRNLAYCQALKNGNKNVSHVMFKNVGHAFQVLNPDSQRIPELLSVLGDFINKNRSASASTM